ncbi:MULTISPECIES: hypothetical protein [unclassified Pseudonocardia]|uniref:hypothetical protein n=1 Tax=unclassified Pseudonocardia TaxID=2619320 RepID=UPI0001FFE9F2|nr:MULTISPECIES: hypothetical protein [unclassified Pseudonocardia]OLM20413.1 hypothetical protein Ae707Ps1_4672 [Pseudonocardia sp. Ae707_Ps1]
MEMDVVPRLGTIVGLVVVLVAIGLLLRWTFGHQKNVTLPTDDPDDPVATGLLTEVSRVPGKDAARILRDRLRAQGIRATITPGSDDRGGFALLVFPKDVPDARVVLSRGALD